MKKEDNSCLEGICPAYGEGEICLLKNRIIKDIDACYKNQGDESCPILIGYIKEIGYGDPSNFNLNVDVGKMIEYYEEL